MVAQGLIQLGIHPEVSVQLFWALELEQYVSQESDQSLSHAQLVLVVESFPGREGTIERLIWYMPL